MHLSCRTCPLRRLTPDTFPLHRSRTLYCVRQHSSAGRGATPTASPDCPTPTPLHLFHVCDPMVGASGGSARHALAGPVCPQDVLEGIGRQTGAAADTSAASPFGSRALAALLARQSTSTRCRLRQCQAQRPASGSSAAAAFGGRRCLRMPWRRALCRRWYASSPRPPWGVVWANPVASGHHPPPWHNACAIMLRAALWPSSTRQSLPAPFPSAVLHEATPATSGHLCHHQAVSTTQLLIAGFSPNSAAVLDPSLRLLCGKVVGGTSGAFASRLRARSRPASRCDHVHLEEPHQRVHAPVSAALSRIPSRPALN
eukprot:jgi/Ulvmu1/4284/UM002_0003.1